MGHHVSFSLKRSETPVSRKRAKETKKKTKSQLILTEGNFGKCTSIRACSKHAHSGMGECVCLNADVHEYTLETK